MANPGHSKQTLQETAKHYNAAQGDMTAGAKLAGIAASTFQHRVEVTRDRYPDLLKSFKRPRTGPPPVPDTERLSAWNAFCVAAFDYSAAARTLGLSDTTLRRHVTDYAALHKIDLTKLTKTLKDDLHAYRVSESQQSARARLKDSLRLIGELEAKIKDLEWAASGSFQPAEWTRPEHKKLKREHMPYLLTSDFQVGEVIRAEETEAGYGYDSDIFRNRYRRMIDTAIYLSMEHASSQWTYPGFIYVRGGDTIDGSIHPEDAGHQTMTPVEACECVFEEESAGIAKLAEAFGKVEVKAPGAAGNHDRINYKPVSKNAGANSYDRLINFMLRHHFKDDKRVTFQVSESFDVRFPIYERNILFSHGDRIGSRGGQGFIGPTATILRGWQKIIMEQQALGFPVDEVHSGHFHTPFWTPWGWSNGCLPGYSEFAKSHRMRPTPPTQLFGYYHPKRGVVDIKPINLTEG